MRRLPVHYRHAGFFVLRTPLLPLSVVRRLNESAAGAPGATAEQIRERVRTELLQVVGRPEVEEAIYIASPVLHSALARWRASPGSAPDRKLETSLAKYVLRMAARATPFGLFAGTTVGSIGARTELRISEPDQWRRFARIDSALVERLTDELAASDQTLTSSWLVANPTTYRVGDEIRYYEMVGAEVGKTFYLSRVAALPELEAVLEAARDGARFEDLAALLAGAGVEPEEAGEFVLEVVRGGLLHPGFKPSALGPTLDRQVLESLEAHPPSPMTDALAETERGLRRLNGQPLGADVSVYESLRDKIIPATEIAAANPWHVELVKDGDPRLAGEVASDLARAVVALYALNPSRAVDSLAEFRRGFLARFGTREVPLLLALDDEYGVGLEAGSIDASQDPLLRGLAFRAPEAGTAWKPEPVRLLAKLFLDGVRHGEAVIDAAALEPLGEPDPDSLPSAVAVLASLLPPAESGARTLLKFVDGPNAVAFFGRFCHAIPKLESLLREYVRREDAEQPDCWHAELNFLPPGRLGNLVARPAFRSAEIAAFGPPSRESTVRIHPADLLLSLDGNRFVLRSRVDGRVVVPHFTSMHVAHARTSLPLYRFFYLLHGGEMAARAFNWGPFSTAPFLPRVTLGPVILSPARWRVAPDEVASAVHDGAPEARREAVREISARHALPRHVLMSFGDNELRLDLEDPLCGDILLAALRREPVALLEVCGGEEQGVAFTASGLDFANEIVVPLTLAKARPAAHPEPPAAPGEAGERSLAPGSGCLYARIYCSAPVADRLLASVLGPWLAHHSGNGTVRAWFFVRYSDEAGLHLRLRVLGDPARLWGTLLPELHDRLASGPDAGAVSHWDLSTYDREVERYGGFRAVELAEELFAADSEAAVAALEAIAEGDANHRWLLALLSADLYLRDFGISLDLRRRLAQQWSEGWVARLASGQPYPHASFASRFREHRGAIEGVLGANPEALLPAGAVASLHARSGRIQPVIEALRRLDASGQLSRPIPSLLESYVHMAVNRIVPMLANEYETVVYDFLARYYRAELSRHPDARA